MLDQENLKHCLKHEQKRADDATGQIENLNEEVSSFTIRLLIVILFNAYYDLKF
jgi:hypothetical protein